MGLIPGRNGVRHLCARKDEGCPRFLYACMSDNFNTR